MSGLGVTETIRDTGRSITLEIVCGGDRECPHCGVTLDSMTAYKTFQVLGLPYTRCFQCWRKSAGEA